MSEYLTFNGIRKDWLLLLDGRQKSPFAPIKNNLLYVSGMDGARIESTETDVLYITQPIGFIVKDDEDAQMKVEELADWLLTDEPVPLEFSREPNRTYYAKVEGGIEDFERFVNQRKGTITFICPDPYKYSSEKEAIFPTDYVSIINNGTAPAKPIFEFEVLQDTTFAMIQNQLDEYMLMGNPTQVDTPTYQKFERVFYSDGDNMTGWTTANAGEVKGEIMGNMAVQGSTRFQPTDYGSTTSRVWHGPAIKTSLPEPLGDFRMQAWISMYNKVSPSLLGKVEIYLLDVNGNIVTRMGMMDGSARTANMYGLARLYSGESYKTMIYEYGDKMGNWNDFAGILRIQRTGNRWYAYIAKTDTQTGRHHTRRSVFWNDYEDTYNLQVAQVVVYISQYSNYSTPNALGVYSLSVDKINQPVSDDEADIVFKAGDIVTFDHKSKLLLVNGEPRNDLKDFGASFFPLHKGDNELVVLPSDTFSVKARYREAFK